MCVHIYTTFDPIRGTVVHNDSCSKYLVHDMKSAAKRFGVAYLINHDTAVRYDGKGFIFTWRGRKIRYTEFCSMVAA